MKSFDKSKTISINFIEPQDGKPERILKQKLLSGFIEQKEIQKAYLVQVQYDALKERKVALCIQALSDNELEIANSISNIFSPIFRENQHLDIIFLDKAQEVKIKSVCPPFFNRELAISGNPDFYLMSNEWQGLEEPRKCWCIKQLSYGKRDDLILVHIDKPVIYRESKEGDVILNQIILAGRQIGYPIFPLKNETIYVHIARCKRNINENSLVLENDEIENIAWGELYIKEKPIQVKKV